MKFLIPLFSLLVMFSCVNDNKNKNPLKKKTKTELQSKKTKTKKNSAKKIGPYAKALQVELKLTRSQLNKYLAINSRYTSKIKKIRADKTLDKKALRIARNEKLKQDELKKLLGKKYNQKVAFDKKWKTNKKAK